MMPHDSCELALVWFRRDLRDKDHAALAAALGTARRVFCVFVFDRDILVPLRRQDRRVQFIHASLAELDAALQKRGGCLLCLDGRPAEKIPRLARRLGVQAVFANRDYEPAAVQRDSDVAKGLNGEGIAFFTFKDQAIFDGDDLRTVSGRPFSVFTPYSRAWLKRLHAEGVQMLDASGHLCSPDFSGALPSLASLGFDENTAGMASLRPGMSGARLAWSRFQERLDAYAATRDFPALAGTSGLSVHLRFGTISIRELVLHAWQVGGLGAETWLRELIWRDFYFQITQHFPHIADHCFKPQFDALHWNDWPEGLAAWQAGQTGYPLVDAGMRQLAETGFMHNRLRMLTASFLCKDLGIDWRLGERHFAACLNDFDLAANNGGWQWCASTGCDAQPWFRIFNPVTQSEKFDPQGHFIRRFVPELHAVPSRHLHAPWRMSAAEQAACGVQIGCNYPLPLVDHAFARQQTLARYAAVKHLIPLPDHP